MSLTETAQVGTRPAHQQSAERLAELVARHAPSDGTYETALEGIRLFRVSTPVERMPGVYDPSVCAVVAGSKLAYHDGQTHTYGPGNYLCTTMPTPLEAEVPDVTIAEPVLGVLVDLATRAMTELLIQHRARRPAPVAPEAGPTPGPVVAPWDEPFTTALVRVLELLDDAPARDLLADGRLRELHYTVVEGPAGPSIQETLGAPTHQLTHVLIHMRNNLDQRLAVEDLAERAGMSRAAFDRHFRTATGLSPLRYLKALRLNDAAMLIAGGQTISQAANQVGYGSPSQFSREFKRHFGTTPRSWASEPATGDPQAFRNH